ncbi:carboxypeptidase regulatory-like domain-containing protein [Paraburkholderia strydomiana]|uniref:carboxypeptidase regulatory-like domain-containing protein n=1 Tax=Paraburkholderia strydomiana TaxID=1245417 RepID=UPI0038BD7385
MKRVALALGAAMIVAGRVMAASTASAQTDLPPAKVQGAITYVSGGIGQDEVNAIRQAAAQYPLELEFARTALPQNEYVSDIKVLIKDHLGRPVLDIISDGPFLLAKLPDGKYTVTADRHGNVKQRTTQIKAQQHVRLIFVWQR